MTAAHDTQALAAMTPCGDCGMPCRPTDYHPMAACLMFKACHDSDRVTANLQAVREHALASRLQEQEGQPALTKAAVHAVTVWRNYGWSKESQDAIEALGATLAAGSQAVQVPGWRPIETAPKDGTVLLSDGYTVGEGFWHDGSQCHGHRGGAGWFWESDRGDLLIASNAGATHWMPMPAAPLKPLAGGEVR